ncbi:MAG: hypothetical protein IT306_00375 [Chloroflexi bacterium]|nr:hypothetical protein [Chloroflexota bacterium]
MEEQLTGRSSRNLRDVGGTSGGLGTFLLGLVMAVGGGYLFLEKVTVRTSYWSLFGYNAFGLSLVPLLLGILLLFYNGKGILGWLLVVAGLAIIGAGILMSLDIFFQPTSLFQTLMILVLLVGGLGLIGRSLLPR